MFVDFLPCFSLFPFQYDTKSSFLIFARTLVHGISNSESFQSQIPLGWLFSFVCYYYYTIWFFFLAATATAVCIKSQGEVFESVKGRKKAVTNEWNQITIFFLFTPFPIDTDMEPRKSFSIYFIESRCFVCYTKNQEQKMEKV